MLNCIFCEKNIKNITTKTIECDICNNLFPNLTFNNYKELWEDFINKYLSSIPQIFPYTVAFKMKEYFENDFKRIFHALNVANYAYFIAKKENGDLNVVLCCGYLHDIGIKNSELKYNSSAPKYQEIEGPPVAEEILSKLKAPEKLIKEVCDIIGHHHSPKEVETINFKCLYDADLIQNWIDGIKERNVKPQNIDKILNLFYTETGKKLIKNIFQNVQ